MPHFVLVATDIAWPLAVSTTVHTGLPPPVVPTVEAPAPMFWPPGFAFGQNKLTRTVLHRKKPIAQIGHDIGTAIAHVGVPPNPFNVLQTALSSRRVNFATSKVWMNARNVAAGMLTAWPPTPMTSCADPMGLPTTCAPFARLNSVVFGMTPTDRALGWGTIVADAVADLACAAVGKAVSSREGPIAGWLAGEATKAGLRGAAGVVRVHTIEGRVIAGVSSTWFGPYFSDSVEVVRSIDGESRVTVERRIGRSSTAVEIDPRRRRATTTRTETRDGDGSIELVEIKDGKRTTTTIGTNPFDDYGEPLGPPRTEAV